MYNNGNKKKILQQERFKKKVFDNYIYFIYKYIK